MSKLDLNPVVLQCAKQIYNNLKLTNKISLLSNTKESLPVEVHRMQQIVLLFNEDKIRSIVKNFLQSPNPKKTLNDFISRLDLELEVFSALPDDEDDEDDDEFEELKNEDLSNLNQIITTKRTADFDKDLSEFKRRKSNLERFEHLNNTSNKYLSGDTKLAETHNILFSPDVPPNLFDNVNWIVCFEIARFVQSFDLKWNDIPLGVFNMFLNVGNSDPASLYETMVKWNQETRLGVKTNALAYTKMDRCFDNVWGYIRKLHQPTPALSPIESPVLTPTMDPSSYNIPSNSIYNSIQTIRDTRTIHYSGLIRFKTRITEPCITLRKPKLESSNRLFRKFGSDRFLELKLSPNTAPFLIKKQSSYFLKPFLLMQRIYKFLFIKDDTVVLFATEGNNLEPISIEQVVDWHMPIRENLNMTMSKYASRMALGYSSSTPTVVFKPEEIVYIDDIYATTGSAHDETACMTDGCGLISYSAMKQIMSYNGSEEVPCAIQGRIAGAKGIWIIAPDLDFECGNYIKIRASQNKFKTGLRQSDGLLDPHHYTFDMVKHSICVYPSNLNTQFIQCLSAGGVPTSVFVEILIEYINRLSSMVTESQSIKILRDWVGRCGHIMAGRLENEKCNKKGLWADIGIHERHEGDDETDSGVFTMNSIDDENDSVFGETEKEVPLVEYDHYKKNPIAPLKGLESYNRDNRYSGHPCSLHETVVRLLDSGFGLSNAYVASRVTMVFRQAMQAITTKYKIEVLQSCTVTCVPDPTGTLEEGEVFLQLSSRRTDEKTNVRVGQILGDVVVTRNPCGLKSDIQKVKAVDCTALRIYTDVIIFSVKGEVSLASKLSGGDYDGDIVFCCWDERIVKPFNSSAIQPEPKRSKEAFLKDKKTLAEEIASHETSEEAIQKNFISVTLPDGTLGTYENWRTVLAERYPFDHPDIVYLAHMCAKLVDAPKQGLQLKSTVLQADKVKFVEMPYPPWFMDKKNKMRKLGHVSYGEKVEVYTLQGAPSTTAMDFLYEALNKETAAFTKFSRSMFYDPDIPYVDSDLTLPWLKAIQLSKNLKDDALIADLELIKNHVNTNLNDYNKQCTEYDLQKQQFYENSKDPSKFAKQQLVTLMAHQFSSHFELEEYFAKDFLELPSFDSYRSNIFQFDIKTNGGKMIQSIKASYSYYTSSKSNKYSKYSYIVAYDYLRRIKADAVAKKSKENGFPEMVEPSAYRSLNIDKGWLKRLRESKFIEEDIQKIRTIDGNTFRNIKK